MIPSYKRDKNHNYLVFESPEKAEGNEYQICMMTKNQIPFFLNCEVRMIDGNAVYFYEITGMQSIYRKYQKTALNGEDIRVLVDGLRQAMEQAERYLLDTGQILMDTEYMFLNNQTGELRFCLVPLYEGDVQQEFLRLSEYILKNLDHNDEQAVTLGYNIYNQASSENYNLSEVLESIHKVTEEDKDDILEETTQENPVPEEKKIEKSKEPEVIKEVPKPVKNTTVKTKKNLTLLWYILGGIGGTGAVLFLSWAGELNLTQTGGLLFLVLGILLYFSTLRVNKKKIKKKKKRKTKIPTKDEGTIILDEGVQTRVAVLVSIEPDLREDIRICCDELHIGKSQADAVIPLDVISRVHAKICRNETSYFLMDCSSTNGTFINGNRIPPQEMLEVKEGDIISFATASYILRT